MAQIAFKFRIYPTEKQKEIIDAHFRLNREIYNYFLGQQMGIDSILYENFLIKIFGTTLTNDYPVDDKGNVGKFKQYQVNGQPVKLTAEQKIEYKKYRNEIKTNEKLWFDSYASYGELKSLIRAFPEAYKYVEMTSSHMIGLTLGNLDTAFNNIKKTGAGFPKFKSMKDSVQSYTLGIQYKENKPSNFKLKTVKTFLNANGKFKKCRCKINLPSSGKKEHKLWNLETVIQRQEFVDLWNDKTNLKINSATVSINPANEYYVSIQADLKTIMMLDKKSMDINTAVGVDCNIGHIVTSCLELNKNPDFKKNRTVIKETEKIKLLSKKLSLKKGNKKNEPKSNTYKQVQHTIAKINRKLKNKRDYSNNVASKALVDSDFNTIVFEDLNIKDMVSRTTNETERVKQNTKNKRSMRRNMHDMSWNDLVNKVTYKAERQGKNVVKINPRNTSKTCNKCGFIKLNLTLRDRQWTCPDCGSVHDRDFNAAINIKNKQFVENNQKKL